MKWTVFFLVLLFYGLNAGAQEIDTLYYASGKVTSSVTKKPVNAHIRYNSLPYGVITGEINGSSFRFALFDVERYEVIVSASGFKEMKAVLDPIKAGLDRIVEWNVELEPAGSDQAEVNNLQRLDNLIFETGTSKIDTTSFKELDQVAKMLQDNPAMVIQLEGHTDPEGDADKNLRLSENRVEAVKSYLILKGADKNQVRTKAYGGTQPLSREKTEESHRLNRRVEMRILSR